MKKDYIVIHHSGSSKGSFGEVKRRHVEELGWSDIGCHFVIGNGNGMPDGEVAEGRPLDKGCCQSRGFNSKAVSILLIGNFDVYYPSRSQWAALVSLVKGLMERLDVPADNVIGHRETYPLLGREPERSCPGWKFDMDKLRKEVYEGGSELFSDGSRRGFVHSVSVDGTTLQDIDLVVEGNALYLRASDLEKVFGVAVEFQPRLHRLEITTKSGTE